MKTKESIVERLLEERRITAEEAVVLLKEASTFQQFTPSQIIRSDGKVPYHEICGCDICNCIMANRLIDPNSSENWQTDFNYTTSYDFNGCPHGPVCFCSGACKNKKDDGDLPNIL